MPYARFSALILLSFLLGACASRQAIETRPEKSTVIVVHGLFANEFTMRSLHNGLTAADISTLSPNLTPSDGSIGIDDLAGQLKEFIDARLAPNAPIQIVAHSMGGLVSQYYLEKLGGNRRCRALYTLATPHHGTILASIHPGPAGRQMEIGSSFIKNLLRLPPPRYPVTCYRSSTDLVILPNESATLPGATNLIFTTPGHIYLTRDREVQKDLVQRIKNVDHYALSVYPPLISQL